MGNPDGFSATNSDLRTVITSPGVSSLCNDSTPYFRRKENIHRVTLEVTFQITECKVLEGSWMIYCPIVHANCFTDFPAARLYTYLSMF